MLLPHFMRYRIQHAAHSDLFSSCLLLLFSMIALVWANSPWSEVYFSLLEAKIRLGINEHGLTMSFRHWVNDGLMAIFFFVVGLEIKREILVGELTSIARAIVPVLSALGGMIFPAAIYLAFNLGSETVKGWGIPIATDIAFAIGIVSLLGSRIPGTLKIFLTAIAIADDIGAILVIAIFYTQNISWLALALVGGIVILLAIANRRKTGHASIYLFLGVALWLAFLESGIHATLAGVFLAFLIPGIPQVDPSDFVDRASRLLAELCRAESKIHAPERHQILYSFQSIVRSTMSPLRRFEYHAKTLVNLFVLPIFALANAGVTLRGDLISSMQTPVALGIFFGLVLGKQIGIFSTAWVAVRLGLSRLPTGLKWKHVYGTSVVAGVGFTMSLFIEELAFGETQWSSIAKVSVLGASLVSGLLGYSILWMSAGITSKGSAATTL